MRGIDHSYFHPFLCVGTHYVVVGHTEDQFCSDTLQLMDVRMELHRHLLEQGFDAVIFFDELMKLYCFDERSFEILLNGRPAEEWNQHRSHMHSVRPGGRRSRQPGAGQAMPARMPTDRLNLGNISDEVVWNQLTALLSTTEYRVALVLNSENSLQAGLLGPVMQLFQELSSYRTRNHSVVIHLFRQTDLSNLTPSLEHGNLAWNRLYETILKPCIDSDSAENNRVISLRTPNAAEVRNLLNHLRLRADNPIAVDAMEVNELAVTLSDACGRKDWGLRELILRIENYALQHPGEGLSMANWKPVMGDEGYSSSMERLQDLVGMEELKEQLRSMRSTAQRSLPDGVQIPAYSSRFSAPSIEASNMGHRLNVQLRGGPGTGKTTVARLMGEIYKEVGMLPQGHLVETNASELVSANVGATAGLVRSKIQEAVGGVLFIDEAYQLMSNDHGREAIDQLVADMSRYEGQLAVVVAGYPDQIQELIDANPGMARRFPTVYELPDYTGPQMRQILDRFVARENRSGKRNIHFSPELQKELDNFCENWVNSRNVNNWGNAGEAQNLLMDMIFLHDRRQERLPAERQDDELTAADIPANLKDHLKHRTQNLNEAMAEVDKMIGLNNVKAFLRQLARNILMGSEEKAPGNYVFHGPPGTGKTYTARKMGEMLRLLGVLKRGHLVEREGGKLKENPLDPSEDLNGAVREARGGVLFIDEAHQMDPGVVQLLVPIIENPQIHADTAFVLAGYTTSINRMLRLDPGLARRFPLNHRIRFDNYTAQELTMILKEMAEGRGERPTRGYLNRSQIALQNYLDRQAGDTFGNAGYIRDTYLPDSIAARTNRLTAKVAGDAKAIPTEEQVELVDEDELHLLTELDIPVTMEALAGPLGMPPPKEQGSRRMLKELFGKQAVVDFANTLSGLTDGERFTDEAGMTGMNFSVCGPLGSGRHEVCRVLHAVWHEQGRLTSMKPNFVGRADMVAEYVGQTATRTRDLIEANLGGMLVVVGPGSMLPMDNTGRDFGPEALDVLAGAMQQYSDRMSFVLLDSKEELDRLYRSYPGMKSSLAKEFELDDLSVQDMQQLFELRCRDSIQLVGRLDEPDVMRDFIINWVTDRGGLGDAVAAWGNGREIDRLCDELKQNWKLQNGEIGSEERRYTDENGEHSYQVRLRKVTVDMLPKRLRKYLKPSSEVANDALQELRDLTGLTSVKTAVENIERRIYWTDPEDVTSGLYCFLGNPGVGKTKVAKLMGGILKAAKVLEIGHVVERTARQMASDYPNFEKTLKLARGGVLFIDEAHQLRETPAGNEVIKRLLTALEDVEVIRQTCIILAGYPREMMDMLNQDSGLQSRFGTVDSILVFEDYTPEELLQILDVMAAAPQKFPQIGARLPLHLDAAYRAAAGEVFQNVCSRRDPKFGNARFVRNFLHDSISEQLRRLDREYGREKPLLEQVRSQLTEEDIPARFRGIARHKYPQAHVQRRLLCTDEQEPVTEENYQRRVERLAQSAVFLEITMEEGTGSGSGTILTRDGYILTASHNVQNPEGRVAKKIRARLYTPGAVGGDYRWMDCEILENRMTDCDMALLKLKGENFPSAPVRPQNIPVDNTEEIFMIGYPLGERLTNKKVDSLHYSQAAGRISSIQQTGPVQRCYADIKGLHGDSGAGVYSRRDGRLIGVFTGSIIPDMENSLDELNYFYPIHYFWSRFPLFPPRDAAEKPDGQSEEGDK